MCKNQAFTEKQWRTFLAEITYMVNSQPLYPSSKAICEEPPTHYNFFTHLTHSNNDTAFVLFIYLLKFPDIYVNKFPF